MVIAVVKNKQTNKRKQNKNQKQPVGVSESEGVLSELYYPCDRLLCDSDGVGDGGWSRWLGTREVGVNGCGVTRDPFPSDPLPSFSPSRETWRGGQSLWSGESLYSIKKPRKSAQGNENLTGKRGGVTRVHSVSCGADVPKPCLFRPGRQRNVESLSEERRVFYSPGSLLCSGWSRLAGVENRSWLGLFVTWQ